MDATDIEIMAYAAKHDYVVLHQMRLMPKCRQQYPNQYTWRAQSMPPLVTRSGTGVEPLQAAALLSLTHLEAMTRQFFEQFQITMMLPTSALPASSSDADQLQL